MPSYRFYQIDVFTDQAFGGNQLAVFPNAEGLNDDDMQRIAREMNLAETTFVFSPTVEGADHKVKIFTPEREMPFAGHPVIGTQWLLAHIGKTKLTGDITKVTFELKVGLRAATLHAEDGKVRRVVMDHQKPEFGAKATPEQAAQLAITLKLTPESILDTGWPVQVVSTGIRQLFIPIRSLGEMRLLSPSKVDVAKLHEICEALDPIDQASYTAFLFCKETEYPHSTVHSRMFAPGIGVPEDAATGSASGGLGAYLVQNCVVEATPPTTYIVSEQGIEMHRYSNISIEVDGGPDNITMVRVGGEVTPLIEGIVSW
jgi:trans-2,3-dihydro-3-hydroxyanthranilate isomerase